MLDKLLANTNSVTEHNFCCLPPDKIKTKHLSLTSAPDVYPTSWKRAMVGYHLLKFKRKRKKRLPTGASSLTSSCSQHGGWVSGDNVLLVCFPQGTLRTAPHQAAAVSNRDTNGPWGDACGQLALSRLLRRL